MIAKTLAILLTASLLLAGCGNKGPLVLPPAPAADGAPAFEDVPPPGNDPEPPEEADEDEAEPVERPEPPSAAR